jgi:uncharacterized Zn-binding protein involved in type VI secretion
MPTRGNVKAGKRFAAILVSVTRPAHNSKDETRLVLHPALLINGLPVVAVGRRSRCGNGAG